VCTGDLRMRFPVAWKGALVIGAATPRWRSQPATTPIELREPGRIGAATPFHRITRAPTVSSLNTPHCRLRLALHSVVRHRFARCMKPAPGWRVWGGNEKEVNDGQETS
jgi:hypothetical protein